MTIRTQLPRAWTWPAALTEKGYQLRPETEADTPFLVRLYGTTREAELASVPWTPQQKAGFIAQQFHAQRHHYRTAIENCVFDVIEQDHVPIGRLYLQERQTQWHIVDIALMPEACGQGVGSAIIHALIIAAGAEDKGVGIFVEKYNPAQRLYRRLGFTEIADHGVYWEMERLPG
jgi:ribosomal protein S18 acetylase RimI-like enzyme